MRFSFISFQEMEPERSQFYVFIVGAGASYTKLLFKTPKFFHSKPFYPLVNNYLTHSPRFCACTDQYHPTQRIQNSDK